MENGSNNQRKMKRPRQDWNPHWILKLLYGLWQLVFTGFKIAVGAAGTVIMIGLVCGFVFVGILGDYLEKDVLPESADYEFNIADQEQTSYVYYVDKNGDIQLLQQIHTVIDRQWVRFEDIPENLINAAIAIEDKRFYEHQGVDWITTVKACLNMFMGGDSQFGGSTITQQLVKNDTGDKSVTVQRKVMEIFRAQYAEKLYEKETIMEYYLNTIYFGRGCYGVKSAAEEYFGKELKSLSVAECAALIGITNNPSLYNPFSESEYKFRDFGMTTGVDRNRIRQLNILGQMYEQGMITEDEYEEAKIQAENMTFKTGIAPEDKWERCDNESCSYEGIVATYTNNEGVYFCPECGTQVEVGKDSSQEVYSYFVDTVMEDVARDFAALNDVDYDALDKEGKQLYMMRIQQGGFHIYSTLDMEVQNAIDAIYTNLDEIPKTSSKSQLQSGIVVIDNRTGDVVGLSGGVGEKVDHDAFNRAVDSKLQTGSAQKPISVYAPAFESGAVHPGTAIKDMPISYSAGNYPKNANRKYDLWKNVFNGITSSVNTIAVGTLQKIGFEYSFTFAKDKLGLTTLTREYPLANGESLTDLGYSPLALGALTVGATIRDMSEAYATFANGGVWREGRTYTKVYDSEGNLVLDNTQDTRQVMGDKAVNYMNYCLYHAASGGTGTAALFRGVNMNIAGKTGTTGDDKDRWFCGFTGYYTAAVWCGYDQPEVIRLQGDSSNPACRLWRKVLQPLHVGKENKSLFSSKGFGGVSICLDTGLIATAACNKDVRGISRSSFASCYPEDVSGGACNRHTLVDYCVTGGGVATKYCSKFEDVKIKEVSLVKRTASEINEIKAARGVGLDAKHLMDNYIWYLDGDWHGFSGKLQPDVSAPYILCPVHTEEAWEKMEEEKRKEEEEKKKEEEEKKKQEEEKKKQDEQADKVTKPRS